MITQAIFGKIVSQYLIKQSFDGIISFLKDLNKTTQRNI